MPLSKAAQPGDNFIYDHALNEGLGQVARGEVLTAEMTELDLNDGTPVTVVAIDEDTGEPIVNWTDRTGIDRMTTIITAVYGQHFTQA